MTGLTSRRAYAPADFRRVFVQNDRDLEEVASVLAGADAVGLDVEMVQRAERLPGGNRRWSQILALIQIASADLSVVVDPLRCRSLSGLRSLLAGHSTKVFLGGGQDSALLEEAGLPVRTVVDVGEVALAIFGPKEDGMAALAHRIFDVTLDKTVRRTDWLARPLTPALISYAHRDAELTLLIYRWMQDEYPDLLHAFEREELDPPPPVDAPEWLRQAMRRSSTDVMEVVLARGLDPNTDAARLAGDVRAAMTEVRAPRQTNRLIRIASDLGLTSLLDEVLPYLDSPSIGLRASAARAIGRLAEPAIGEPLLAQLASDPSPDVRKSAIAAVKEIRAPQRPEPKEEAEEETAGVEDGPFAALQTLKDQIEGEAG